MSEEMKCRKCGGWFLEDYEACTCQDDRIKKLEKKIKALIDDKHILYAIIMDDVCDLPDKLQKKANKICECL